MRLHAEDITISRCGRYDARLRVLLTGIAVTLALAAAACTANTTGDGAATAPAPTTTGSQSTTAAPAAAFTPGPFGPAQLDADITELATWGIETFDDPAAIEPAVPATAARSPLRLLRSQVEQLGKGAAAGTGLTGAAWDDVMNTATGADVPMATLLAGYATSDFGTAPRLRALSRIVDTAHPADAVFPSVLVLAFIRDMVAARRVERSTQSRPRRCSARTPLPAVGRCARAASNFLSDVLHKTFDGLKIDKIDTSGWAPIFKALGDAVNAVTSVLNALTSGAEFVIINGLNYALAPIRNTLGSLAMVAAVAIQAASAGAPPRRRHHDRQPACVWDRRQPGDIHRDAAHLDRDADRVARARQGLRPTDRTSPCPTWRSPAARSSGNSPRRGRRRRPRRTSSPRTAHKAWPSSCSTPAPNRRSGTTRVLKPRRFGGLLKATVHRKTKVLQSAVQEVLDKAFGFLPEFLRYRAVGFVSAQVNEALDKIVKLSDTVFSLPFDIAHHGPPDRRRRRRSPASAPGGGAVWVHVERPDLPGAYAGRIMDITSCTGIAGPWQRQVAQRRTACRPAAHRVDRPADDPVPDRRRCRADRRRPRHRDDPVPGRAQGPR